MILPLLLAVATIAPVPSDTCPNPPELLPCRIRNARTGKLIRSAHALTVFRRCTGYPKGRPGFVIDHVVPLACGGCDLPENMQFQSIKDGKAKDAWERKRANCVPWTGKPDAAGGDSRDDEPGQ